MITKAKPISPSERKWMANQCELIASELQVSSNPKKSGKTPFEAVAQLKKDLETANERVASLEAARRTYASEFPPGKNGEFPDVGSIHQNIRAIKIHGRHILSTTLLRTIQSQLYVWINASTTGGWSTHLVDPMRKLANEIGETLAKLP